MLLAATPQGDSVELTQELIEHIEDLEGFSEEAYRDVNGVLTIGFGHTNATGTFEFDEDTKISREKAEAILLADLNNAQSVVEQRLENRNLEVNDEVKNYMILVEFNRPWVLKETMKDIATMNADLAKQSQIDAYEKEKGTPPDWYLNRLDKEFAYLNEFDAKGEEGGNAEGLEQWKKYKFLGGVLIPEDATNEIWAEALRNLYGPTDRSGVIKGYNPAKPQAGNRSWLTGIRKIIGDPVDKQLDFMERVYGRRQ